MTSLLTVDVPGVGLGLERVTRDLTLTRGDNEGVRGEAIYGSPTCYAGGSPANGATLTDVMGRSNGSFVKESGQTVTFADGGFDLSAITSGANYAQGGADFTADISAAVGGFTQRYSVCIYLQMPSAADWVPPGQIYRFAQYANVFYTSGPDLFTLEQTNIGADRVIQMRRQVATGPTTGYSTMVATAMRPVPTWIHEHPAALLISKSATGISMGVYHPAYGWTEKAEVGALADNPANVSGLRLKVGSVPLYAGASLAAYGGASNMKLFGHWEENLARSLRDTKVVVERHFGLCIERGLFG